MKCKLVCVVKHRTFVPGHESMHCWIPWPGPMECGTYDSDGAWWGFLTTDIGIGFWLWSKKKKRNWKSQRLPFLWILPLIPVAISHWVIQIINVLIKLCFSLYSLFGFLGSDNKWIIIFLRSKITKQCPQAIYSHSDIIDGPQINT